MIKYYLNLLNYDFWANERILSSIKNSAKNDKILELFSHIAIAQEIWLSRLQKRESEFKTAWSVLNLTDAENLLINSNKSWQNYLNEIKEEDLELNCEYVNTKGEYFKKKVSDIITHVINHSTYHRGQIAYLIRADGFPPQPTDYIVYSS